MIDLIVSYTMIDNSGVNYDEISHRSAINWIYPRLRTWGTSSWKKQHQLAVL